jgi:cyanophycinase
MAKEKKVNREASCPVPNGTLLIVGGGEDKGNNSDKRETDDDSTPLEVLKSFIELIPNKKPIIEVITTASSEGDEAFDDYRKSFNEIGVKEVRHIHHTARKQLLEDSMAERLQEADAVFMSGGDQLKLTSIYGGTSFLRILKERYIYDELVIGGTSAGAMAMSTPMIYAGSKEVQQLTSAVKVTTGLEFLKDACIDTHFVDRSRLVRMAQVIVTNPSCIGIGIEEDTAIIVRNGLDAEVVGTGIVIIVDGFHIGESNIYEFTSEKPVSIRDLKIHLLSRGDKYRIPQCNPPHI